MGNYSAATTETRPTVAIVRGTVSRHVKGTDKNGRPWAGFTIDRGDRGRAIQCVAWRNQTAASLEVGQTVLVAGTFAVKAYKDKAGADRQAVQLEVAVVQAEPKAEPAAKAKGRTRKAA
ncbi:MAG TPA: single-stranded DNA-binding protein [Rhodospirillaceae bacterium]|nr:single-stranded DNA-binding protein [Rhodospirillaceae bacterium]